MTFNTKNESVPKAQFHVFFCFFFQEKNPRTKKNKKVSIESLTGKNLEIHGRLMAPGLNYGAGLRNFRDQISNFLLCFLLLWGVAKIFFYLGGGSEPGIGFGI